MRKENDAEGKRSVNEKEKEEIFIFILICNIKYVFNNVALHAFNRGPQCGKSRKAD